MIIIATTNNNVRKTEYSPVSAEGVNLLSQVPTNLYSIDDISRLGKYTDSNYISIYFKAGTSLSYYQAPDNMFSMKYNTDDGSYYFKTYERGNTSANNVSGVIYTGRFSHNNNYTLYFGKEARSLEQHLEDGMVAKTYDENHNELFEVIYTSDVFS